MVDNKKNNVSNFEGAPLTKGSVISGAVDVVLKTKSNSKKIILFGLIVLIIAVIIVLFFSFSSVPIFNNQTFQCTGEGFENAILCGGENNLLDKDYSKVLLSTCSENPKCEYVCVNGFELKDNKCMLPSLKYSCVGSVFENAILCPQSNQDLTQDSNFILSDACTVEKNCEYICNSGYLNDGQNCIKEYCVQSSTLDFKGEIVAIASAGKDANAGLSPLGSNAPYFLIFDNNVLIESAQNPYSKINADENVTNWLVGKKVTTLVLADVSYGFDSNLNNTNIKCLKMNGRISDIIGIKQSGGVYDFVNNYCKTTVSVNQVGTKLAVLTINSDLNSPISPNPNFLNYFLIFENGVFVNSVKIDFNKSSSTFNEDLLSLLKANDINRVVVGYQSVPFVLGLNREKIDCLRTVGIVNKVVK